MKGKKDIGDIHHRSKATTKDCCNEVCRFFLGASARKPGMGLCSNPDYIKIHETCQAVMGTECDYYEIWGNDYSDLRHISLDYAGQENRQLSRTIIYNSMLLGIVKGTEVTEYPSIILDISSIGIGCIIPVTLDSFPQEFYAIKRFPIGKSIKVICKTRRVIRHSSVTEIGASFSERISDEVMTSLLKTGR
jgi:hypothetical protein